MTDDMLAAARAYAARGWLLFPVRLDDKRPAIATGRDHAEHATSDSGQLEAWHRAGLLRAIGLACGASGVIVIDADAKHDGGRLLTLLERKLGRLPLELVARTRSGGLHVYLRRPTELARARTGAGKCSPLGRLLGGLDGVDVRADGGIVVLPPSCGYRWVADGPLPDIPRRWLAAIQGAHDPPPRPMPRGTPVPDDRKRAIDRARAYLARMPASIAGSGGHAALWSAIVSMVRGFMLPVDDARDLVASEFNPRCDPPWSEREIEHKLRQAADRARIDGGYLIGRKR